MKLSRALSGRLLAWIVVFTLISYAMAFLIWMLRHDGGFMPNRYASVVARAFDKAVFEDTHPVPPALAEQIKNCATKIDQWNRLHCMEVTSWGGADTCPGKFLLLPCVTFMVPDYILFSRVGERLVAAIRRPCRFLSPEDQYFRDIGCQTFLGKRPYMWVLVARDSRVRIKE